MEGGGDPGRENPDDADDMFQAKFYGRSFALPTYEVSPFVYFFDTFAGTCVRVCACVCVFVCTCV